MDDGIITASDACRDFSRLLETVEAGSSVTITRDGRPVAVMQPVQDLSAETKRMAHDRLMRLLREGMPLGFTGGIDRDALHER